MVHPIEKLIHLIYDCEEKIKQCKIKLHHFYHNRDGLKKLEEEKRIVIYKFMCRRMCDDVCTADAWAVTKGEGGYSGL